MHFRIPERYIWINSATKPTRPRATITFFLENQSNSRSRKDVQLASSRGCGLLSGGAQRAAAVMYASFNSRPSPRWVALGWLSNPVSYSTGYIKLPDESPVKGRPVRLEP